MSSREQMVRLSALVIFSVATVGSVEPADDADRKSATSSTWAIETVGDDIGAFSHVSVAVDPVSEAVFISWYDFATQNLWWARTVDTGGNCGPGNAWLCERLVSGGNVGLHSSIAVYPADGGASEVVIAFYDATHESLWCVRGTVDGTDADMSLTLIDSGFNDPDRTGLYTATAFDSKGVPWIAYQNETYDTVVGTHRMVAHWLGDGSGNCGEAGEVGGWECFAVFSNGWEQAFSWSGISFDDEDNPVVAYFNKHEAKPEIAQWVATGGNCGPSDSWRCHKVSPRYDDTLIGWNVVPYVANNVLTMFYQNPHRDVLERAIYVGGSGGNCGYNTTGMLEYEWQCDTITDMDGVGQTRAIAVAPDTARYPIVAFQYGKEPGPATLGVARPTASPEVTQAGNCGPGDSWYCEIIDGGPDRTEADSVAVATEPGGTVTIAYHEVDTYPYPAEHNLKLATVNTAEIFSDGFESSTTAAWSSVVP